MEQLIDVTILYDVDDKAVEGFVGASSWRLDVGPSLVVTWPDGMVYIMVMAPGWRVLVQPAN
jgi:hypothetical protein